MVPPAPGDNVFLRETPWPPPPIRPSRSFAGGTGFRVPALLQGTPGMYCIAASSLSTGVGPSANQQLCSDTKGLAERVWPLQASFPSATVRNRNNNIGIKATINNVNDQGKGQSL